jgi:serine phosphatase RsbU (regulator of sigma subunit)
MHIMIRDENRNVRTADIADDVDCVTCGSSPECDIYLPDVRIHDTHFVLRRREDRKWWLEHCPIPPKSPAEYTRLYINALQADEAHPVRHNDEILVARFTLNVFTDDANASAPRSALLEEAVRIREHPLPSGSIVRSENDETLQISADVVGQLATFAFDVHACQDLNALMALTVSSMTRLFKAHQVWMGARRHGYGRIEFVESRLASGKPGGDPPRLSSFQYRCGDRGQYICCPNAEAAQIESAMCVPLMGGRAVLGMLYVANRKDAPPYGEQDLDLFSAYATVIARQLERILREQVHLQEAIRAGEWSFMRELQASMDPTNAPQWESLQLAVYCRPGSDSAGDIYDVMRLPNGLASFMCATVRGSPTMAALGMAEVRAAFRYGCLHADPPHVVMRASNWLLHDPQRPASMSFIGLVMNPRTGAMQYASAGSVGAVLVDQRGEARSLIRADVPEVGLNKECSYTADAGRLQVGESLVLYTPGCLTLTNAGGERLDRQRLEDAIADGFGQPACTALDELLSDLKAFFREGRQPDDITVMVLHRE